MFSKTPGEQAKGYGTVVESCAFIDGDLASESSVYLAGKLNGDLRCEGDAFVDVDGVVTGSVHAKSVCVAGTVEGSVETGGFLKITSSGRLFGDVRVFRLITEEGAVFEGRCSMADAGGMHTAIGEPRKSKHDAMFRKKDYLDGSIPPLEDDIAISNKN